LNSDQSQDAKLQEIAQRLGAQAAERLNIERTAEAVVTRLRHEPRGTTSAWVWRQPAWLRIAAAVVLVLGAGWMARGLLGPTRPPLAVVTPVGDDLSDLTAEQLRETMRSLEQPLGEATAGVVETGLEGLTVDELRALLRTLEG
jgi:hypothetical protein